MPSLVYSAIGFLISLAGAVVISWPILARTDAQLSVATATFVGQNPHLRTMLATERQFARVGIGMVIVGSSLQFLAATL